MAGDKVRCAVCKHQVNAFCIVKKSRVALNKRRRCNKFKIEPGKVRLKQKIPTTRGVSPHMYKTLRQEYKKALKKEAARQAAVEHAENNKYSEALKTPNEKHPLTGDLSRFTSSAGKE